MANFKYAKVKTLNFEGGNKSLVHDPDDTGGLTYKGIAFNKNTQWKGWVIVKAHLDDENWLNNNVNLQQMVDDFYITNYWNTCGCDKIPSTENGDKMAAQVFDTAVNNGVGTAIKELEESFGLKQTGKLSQKLFNEIAKVR